MKKKFGQKPKKNYLQYLVQLIIFNLGDALNFSLSVCIISFFGRILEHEIFQVKAGTLKMGPFLEDIQIGHKTQTKHTNRLSHIVFMSLTLEIPVYESQKRDSWRLALF